MLDKAVEMHIEFWNELMEKIPDINKLLDYGRQIYTLIEDIGAMNKDLNELDSHDLKCLKLYADFVKQVTNDDIHADPLFEKSELIKWELIVFF